MQNNNMDSNIIPGLEISLPKNKKRYSTVTNKRCHNLIRLVYDQGKTTMEAADILGINYKTALTIASKHETSGNIEDKKKNWKTEKYAAPIRAEKIENLFLSIHI